MEGSDVRELSLGRRTIQRTVPSASNPLVVGYDCFFHPIHLSY